jgi:hypothetical protein
LNLFLVSRAVPPRGALDDGIEAELRLLAVAVDDGLWLLTAGIEFGL